MWVNPEPHSDKDKQLVGIPDYVENIIRFYSKCATGRRKYFDETDENTVPYWESRYTRHKKWTTNMNV